MHLIFRYQVYDNLKFFIENFRQNKERHIGVTFNPIVDPWYLSPGWLDQEHKEFVLHEVSRAKKDFKMTSEESRWLQTMLSELERDFGAKKDLYANDFVRAQLALDKIRKTNTVNIEPRLKRYFDRYDPNHVSLVDEKTKKPAAMFPEGKPSA